MKSVARAADEETIRAVLAGSDPPRNRHAECGATPLDPRRRPGAFASCPERNYRLLSIHPALTPANTSRAAAPVVSLDSMCPALNPTNPPFISGAADGG